MWELGQNVGTVGGEGETAPLVDIFTIVRQQQIVIVSQFAQLIVQQIITGIVEIRND